RREAILAVATESVALPVELGIQNDAAIKLSRGFYVIVPVFEGDSDPSWSSYSLGVVNGRRALVNSAGDVAPFEHFVLRIDYATN
ncbi:MAG TPA: hypothetical protein VF608_12755, partial [Thermoanaerobaculia bacterium]